MRDRLTYSDRRAWSAPEGYGLSVEHPVEGFYKIKLGKNAIWRGVHLRFAPPNDPLTGEVLDRSWRWQAFLDDGSLVEFDVAWPKCAGEPISQKDFDHFVARQRWAETNAPDSAYADRRKPLDLLSRSNPLPF